MAQHTGLSKRTIDYYTNLGILRPIRSDSNYRLYSEEAVSRIGLVQHCKNNKMTLTEIKSLLDKGQNDDLINITEGLVNHFKQIETDIIELKQQYDSLPKEQQYWLKEKINHQTVSLLQAITILLT